MRIKLSAVSAALLASLVLAAPALGQGKDQKLDGTLGKIKTSGVLNIGYRESSPPFSFMGPDKRPVGYSIELCMHVASAIQKQLGLANLKLGWVPVTAQNRIDMVVQGKVDLECSTTTASLSRQERVDFSLMIFIDGGSLLVRLGDRLARLNDFMARVLRWCRAPPPRMRCPWS